MTYGFDRAKSRYGLRNHQRNCFQGWHMDSKAQTAPVNSEIINENWVVAVVEIINKTASTGEARFDSAKSPCWLRNHKRNCFQGWRMDSTAQTAPVDSEIINENWVTVDLEILNETASTDDAWIRQRKRPPWPQKSSTKLLPRVRHGFDNANSPCGLRKHQWKLSHCQLKNH